jgi:carbamate kinase
MSRIVLAIGGNALGSTLEEQRNIIKETSRSIVDLVQAGHQIILTHGNGPQVGMVHKAFALASKDSAVEEMPFCECVAMTQGYIGFHLQNAIRNEIVSRALPVWVGALICQVLVDKDDNEFQHPTKPVGAYLDDDEIECRWLDGVTIMEDAGRGYRRALPSPAPLRLLEGGLIKKMAEEGYLLIVSGGGGVPVVEQDGRWVGVDAVVDKDKSSALIAQQIDADMLFLLTAVEQVALNFGTPEQVELGQVSVADMQRYVEEGHFAPGSMLPKIQAALDFAQSGKGKVTLITSLDKALDGIKGDAGTRIVG